MKLVGLTGGIGSGKTTVGKLLVEHGAVLVDADAIVKELQEPGQPVFEAMVERFGIGIVGADGRLDRQAVADRCFRDPDELAALNAIVHPAVGMEMARRVEALKDTDEVVVLDIPLLDRARSAFDLEAVVVVDVPEDTQVERLVRFRGFDEADARARIGRQISRDERLAGADFVLDNRGDEADLAAQVDELWRALRAGSTVTPPP